MKLTKKKNGCFIIEPISGLLLLLGIAIGCLLSTPDNKEKSKQVSYESIKIVK